MSSEPPTRRQDALYGGTRSASLPLIDAEIANDSVNNTNTANKPNASSASTETTIGSQPITSDNLPAMPVHSDAAGRSADMTESEPNSAISQPASPFTSPAIKTDPDSTHGTSPLTTPPTQTITKQEVNIKIEPVFTTPLEVPREVSLENLREVASSRDLALLETGVSASSTILKKLQKYLRDFKEHEEVLTWLVSVNQLQSKSKKAGRTVVAVAGATGAGKSSAINAILDEEVLLPTNGMRACTAVITEICYNYDQDPQKAYRAEVEFISHEEWAAELRLLFEELLDDGQLTPTWRDPDSEAGVAYAKVKAVYPELTHEDLLESNPENLAKVEAVAKVLGTKQCFSFSTASELHSALSRFLDSKEKGSKSKEMALWPVIRVARILTRADALSTNICLVDLPGTLDSNAARSAVAINYMAECTAVWVAARISRAVDDRAAKDLLGRSSRIQMKLDGAYSHLSFIATQIDGINIDETFRSMRDDQQIEATLSRKEELEAIFFEKTTEMRKLEKHFSDLDEAYWGIADEEKIWQALQKKHKRQDVYAPAAPSQRSDRTKRRRKVHEQLDDNNLDASDKVPLTSDEISSKLEELTASNEAMASQCDAVEAQLKVAEDEVFLLKQQKADCGIESAWMCMQKRNQYVIEEIRRDFAAGIREIDEEDEHQAEEERRNPSTQKRDYEEVARSLPVFCISSKAYQQQRKNTQHGNLRTEGFKNLESTGIPSLQQHAKASSREGQIRSNKAYLNQFSQLLNSLTIWSRHEMSGQSKEEVSEYELRFLECKVSKLKPDFDSLVFQLKREILNILRDAFSNKMSGAAHYASQLLESIIAKWSTPEKDGGYGLKFGTYRAVCKRQGHKTTAKSRNFNEDIGNPYLSKISSTWENAFAVTVPDALANFGKTFMVKLREFHDLMLSRTDVDPSILRNLEAQLKVHEATIYDAINLVMVHLQADQRKTSRMFLPLVEGAMTRVYDECAQEKGTGCYNRVKAKMQQFGRDYSEVIYKEAGKKVNRTLQKSFESATNSLLEGTERIRVTLASDYKLVLPRMDDGLHLAREEIRNVLYQADRKFETILRSAAAETTAMDVDTAPVVVPSVEPDGHVGAGSNMQGEAVAVDS